MRKFLIAVLVCAISILGTFPVHASAKAYPTWIKDGYGWKLMYEDGTQYKNDWFYDVDTGLWYYIQNTGYMLENTLSPEGFQVSTSGRLMEPQRLLSLLYHREEIWEYQNNAFRFKVALPKSLKVSYIGAQNLNETNDVNIEGGVKIDFYPGYKLDLYQTAYTPQTPHNYEVESFTTYSGLKGKMYFKKYDKKIYISAQIVGSNGTISADIIGGILESESVAVKTALREVLRGVSSTK